MKAIIAKLSLIPAGFRKAGGVLMPLLIVGVFLAGWWIARPSPKEAGSAVSTDSGTIWTCSMHPTVRQPGPGLCPICEMDLIEVSAGGAGGLRDIVLTPDAVARMDIRVAPVSRQAAVRTIEFLGRVAPDETRVSVTTARVDGRLDRMFIDYTGISVRRGDHLAEIYSPDLYIAQEELIRAKRSHAGNPDGTRRALYQAAREKLRLLGMEVGKIDLIEEQESPTDHITLNAPQDGIVLKLHKREGDYVKEGDALYSLADLGRVWIFLEAYEDDLPWIRFAQDVKFQAGAVPGRSFAGRIAFIDPILDETRRIARIRVNVDNPDGALKPGMFVRGEVRSVLAGDRVVSPDLAGKWISPMHPEIIKDAPGTCDICGMQLVPAEELGFVAESEEISLGLLVPASAVLRTGDRAVVYRRVSTDDGITFEGREIILGPRAGEFFVVESGLREGDLVVTRGAFKLDSELQIQARPAMMLDGQATAEAPGVEAPGTVAGAWKPVLRLLSRARRDIGDGHAFEGHISRARQVVAATDPDFLPEDYEALWREAKMKLENLLAVAARDARRGDAREAWESLADHLPRAAGLAGLSWQMPELQAMPPGELEELSAILDGYLRVADLLAHDRPDDALAAVQKLAPKLRASTLEGVSDTAPAVADADGEKSLQVALKTVTDVLRPLIRRGADDRLGGLYLVHCPMAFGNTGADWFSREAKVENPYFGSRMFSCGDVTETLSLPDELPPERQVDGENDDSGHKH